MLERHKNEAAELIYLVFVINANYIAETIETNSL